MIDEMCFVDSAINGKESNKVIINCRHQSTQRFLLKFGVDFNICKLDLFEHEELSRTRKKPREQQQKW